MNLINRYRIVILIVLPLLILLAIRSCRNDGFKYDAKKWSESSFDNSNVISTSEIGTLSGKKLIVYLDKSFSNKDNTVAGVHIPPDSVLSKNYLKKIKDHKGPVLLSSSDPALSARIWMLISQTGCRNIFILVSSDDNEAFKNEFRPDTLIRPEF